MCAFCNVTFLTQPQILPCDELAELLVERARVKLTPPIHRSSESFYGVSVHGGVVLCHVGGVNEFSDLCLRNLVNLSNRAYEFLVPVLDAFSCASNGLASPMPRPREEDIEPAHTHVSSVDVDSGSSKTAPDMQGSAHVRKGKSNETFPTFRVRIGFEYLRLSPCPLPFSIYLSPIYCHNHHFVSISLTARSDSLTTTSTALSFVPPPWPKLSLPPPPPPTRAASFAANFPACTPRAIAFLPAPTKTLTEFLTKTKIATAFASFWMISLLSMTRSFSSPVSYFVTTSLTGPTVLADAERRWASCLAHASASPSNLFAMRDFSSTSVCTYLSSFSIGASIIVDISFSFLSCSSTARRA